MFQRKRKKKLFWKTYNIDLQTSKLLELLTNSKKKTFSIIFGLGEILEISYREYRVDFKMQVVIMKIIKL